MKHEYYSDVRDGQLQMNVRQRIANDLPAFEGKRVCITITKQKSKRSVEQNKYWWVLVTILANELGFSKEEMHEILKFKFLKQDAVHEDTGEVFQYVGSTAELNKSQFADLIAQLQQWASQQFNVYLPGPGEQTQLI